MQIIDIDLFQSEPFRNTLGPKKVALYIARGKLQSIQLVRKRTNSPSGRDWQSYYHCSSYNTAID